MNYAIFKYGIITLTIVAIIFSIISTKVYLAKIFKKSKRFNQKKFKRDYYVSTLFTLFEGLILGRSYDVHFRDTRCRNGRIYIQF